jgi:hypothetical protein
MFLSAVLSACAFAVSFDDYNARTWAIHGTAAGLGGASLVLQVNNQALEVRDGPFTSGQLADGVSYVIGIPAQPAGRQCSIAGGEGRISGADVSGVEVRCTTNYVVRGRATGLGQDRVLLHITTTAPTGSVGVSDISVGEGPFTVALSDGTRFSLALGPPPTGRVCEVTQHGEGTIAGADVGDVLLGCAQGGTELAALSLETCSAGNLDAGGPCDAGAVPLAPAFASGVFEYQASVPQNCGGYTLSKGCFDLVATPRHSGATLVVRGVVPVHDRVNLVVDRLRPSTTQVDIDVTAPDRVTHAHTLVHVTVLPGP